MAPSDPRDDLERLRPHRADVLPNCDAEGERRDVVCAVFLRETLAGWAPGYLPRGSAAGFGDVFRAFGLAQADLRFFEGRRAPDLFPEPFRPRPPTVSPRMIRTRATAPIPARLAPPWPASAASGFAGDPVVP